MLSIFSISKVCLSSVIILFHQSLHTNAFIPFPKIDTSTLLLPKIDPKERYCTLETKFALREFETTPNPSRKTTTTTLSSSKNTKTGITDWIIENLDENDGSTTSSSTSAGENDKLPSSGLFIGQAHILPASSNVETPSDYVPIRLLLSKTGWGTGVHPTTKLCLEWLTDVIVGGETVLDYGCGSAILSIAALRLGASRVIGVDVEAEALLTAHQNVELNGFSDRFEGLHTREIIPNSLFPKSEICVANILIGQLVRPSMVSAIITNLAPNALLCFSGVRPNEVSPLKEAYEGYVDWMDDEYYKECDAKETEGSVESYGFDVGTWSRVVGRVKCEEIDVEKMSELAVS